MGIIKPPGLVLPEMGFAGFSALGPGCCCGEPRRSCEDTSRPICYVDKYATGAGDGTSWDDAYTTIQVAITACGTTHRIYIQGYGQGDPYSEILTFLDNLTLVGIEDAWNLGSINGRSDCCYYRIHVTGPVGGFGSSGYRNQYVECTVEDSNSAVGFNIPSTTNTCLTCGVDNLGGAVSHVGFAGGTNANCTATEISATGDGAEATGFSAGGNNTNCTATEISASGNGHAEAAGFSTGNDSTGCIASGISAISASGSFRAKSIGFSVLGYNTGCIASGISASGYYAYVSGFGSNTFSGNRTNTNCTATEISASGNVVESAGFEFGFSAGDNMDCIASGISASGGHSSLAVGFMWGETNSGCTCTAPEPSDGCFYP